MRKKGNNKHNKGGNMNNFISRIFVLSLLFSFVYAQDASGIKKGSNDEKVSVKKEQKKSSNGSAARLNNDDTQPGSGSSASKKGGPGSGKATPSGNSSRMSGTTAPAPKQGKKAKKGFLGRLLSRSSKKSSQASGSSAAGSARPGGSQPEPGSKESGKKGDPGETDPRDKP